MDTETRALKAAVDAFDHWLQAEVTEQHSYMHKFSDGKLSVELEGIDVTSLVTTLVSAYMAELKHKNVSGQET